MPFFFCLFSIKYPVPLFTNIKTALEMIKWEHSIFALPFALSDAMLDASGLTRMPKVMWIIVVMVYAR
jgi:4-hydroxybenzoate polyprenyltransferase